VKVRLVATLGGLFYNLNMKTTKRPAVNGGFIKLIIAIVIALIVLSYFGFDLRKVIEAPQTQENLRYFWSLLQNIWFTYIWKGISYIWEEIIIGYLWKNIVLIWQTTSSNF
jgi:hypothetical protein